jgi:hypothetical protein
MFFSSTQHPWIVLLLNFSFIQLIFSNLFLFFL